MCSAGSALGGTTIPSTILPLTWPTRDELDDVLQTLADGMHAHDLLSIRLHHLLEHDHNDSLPEGVQAPTLEDIGALARFAEFARLDISTLEGCVTDVARTYERATWHVSDEAKGGDDA